MLQIMAYEKNILKKTYKNIDTTISLYCLGQFIVKGIYYNYIKSNLGWFYC